MESQNDLNDKIRLTTLKIQEEHPELIKYINEIPRNAIYKADKEVTTKTLTDYLDSLNQIVETYKKTIKTNIMKTTTNLGIWMDHSCANLIDLNSNTVLLYQNSLQKPRKRL